MKNGIIEKSFSPYNSPIWVIPKKGFDKNGKQKLRLVIDFQKLNSQTITDKFPIPDINIYDYTKFGQSKNIFNN